MTPEKIIETYQSVQKVHEEYHNFGTRISWFVIEVILVTILLKPPVTLAGIVLAGLITATMVISLLLRLANKEHYDKIYSVSSSGFIFKCLQYQIEEGSTLNDEDVENVNNLKKTAIRYLHIARLNMIANIFSVIFCIGFLLMAIMQVISY